VGTEKERKVKRERECSRYMITLIFPIGMRFVFCFIFLGSYWDVIFYVIFFFRQEPKNILNKM